MVSRISELYSDSGQLLIQTQLASGSLAKRPHGVAGPSTITEPTDVFVAGSSLWIDPRIAVPSSVIALAHRLPSECAAIAKGCRQTAPSANGISATC